MQWNCVITVKVTVNEERAGLSIRSHVCACLGGPTSESDWSWQQRGPQEALPLFCTTDLLQNTVKLWAEIFRTLQSWHLATKLQYYMCKKPQR